MQNNYKNKDSGIEWLGEVPEHWDIQKVKHVATYSVSNVDKKTQEGETPIRLFNYTDVYNNEYLTNDMELMAASASQGQIDKFVVHIDDVLITKDSEDWRDIAKPALVKSSAPDIVCGYHLALIRPSDSKTDGKFIFRLLQSTLINQQFQINSNGVTRYGLPKSAIGESLIILPPNIEQQSIIQYLDRETSRIDALIQKKERLIEMLKEKRIALITQAVTKGLDPNVPMKDSRIEWIGEVPEHWTHVVLGRVCKIQGGYAFDSSNFVDEGCPIVQMSNLKRGVLDLSEAKKYPYELCPREVKLDEGDILLGMSGSIGDTGSLGNYAMVKKNDLPCYLNQRVGKLDISSKLYRGFVYYLIQSTPFFEQVQLSVTGTAQFNISPSQLGDIWIALPPTTEQNDVSIYLDNETSKMETLMGRVENSITLLREYRSSLINSAVTGKIDLRDAL